MNEIVNSFLMPGIEEIEVEITDLLANSYCRAVWNRVTGSCPIFDGSDELITDFELLESRNQQKGMGYWCPELGLSLAYLRIGDPRAAMAQALAGISDALAPKNWDLHLQATKPDILYKGRVYEKCIRILKSKNDGLVIEATGGITSTPYYFSYSKTDDNSISSEKEVYILPCSGDIGSHEASIWPLSKVLDTDIEYPIFYNSLSDAFRLIESKTPDYGIWIKRALKGMVIFEKDDPKSPFYSSSSTIQPGLVSVSMPISTLSLAETLIHEVSHQYFLLLDYCFPLQDRSDSELYHSPLKKKHRPLEMILLGFHATANMAFFYKRLSEYGASSQIYSELYDEKLNTTLSLAEALKSTSALTEAGMVLRDELLSRL